MLQCVLGFHLEQLQQNSVLLFSPFNFINKKHSLKCFRDLFEIKHTFFFLFMHVTLTKHHNLRNWYLLFYNRTGSNKIHALSIFFFFWYIWSITLKYTFKQTSMLFKLLVLFSHPSYQGNAVRKTASENARYDQEKKNKLNQTTLIEFAKLHLLSDSATIL